MTGQQLPETWQFELYVTGNTARSALAVENLQGICHDYLQGRCHVDVFNIMEHPELTVEKQISASPYLIKTYPLPERKMVGDLSDTNKVLQSLDIYLRGRMPDMEKASREYLEKENVKLQRGRRQR
jgi:circadian clock protein KaiB